ncbi:MAG TPA: hypothetical protein PLS10_04050 [Chitinophagales bacterium]|nr:hypothetical protein [Chitinophagales bacterium]
MKNILFFAILLLALQNTQAQKCDTLRIDGAPNPYGCPTRALNIYKRIYKTVGEAIFEPMNKATINYCDNCSLQNWSNYGYENKWSNNEFSFSNEQEYNWKTIPTGVPCTEEQEPALFLGNIKSPVLIGYYANLPSIYGEGANKLSSIYQTKQDSLTELTKKYDEEVYKQIKSGVSYADIKVPGLKEANAQKLLLADESAFHQMQSSFSVVFTYNKTSIDLYPNDVQPLLKKIPFKLNEKFTIPYSAFDNLVDVSFFQENEDMKQQNDYSKKPKIDSKLGKQYVTWVQLGQNIPNEKEDKIRLSADYSVYNFIVKIQGISFEKNHELLNNIDWNKLYEIINTKKL